MSEQARHVAGLSRDQTLLFPETLEHYVDPENPVRFIDAFIDSLDLEKLGFTHSVPKYTGRPPYNPADLLKLYSYGYLNQTRSSRKLERECHRNVEVMWLIKKLTPDFKTIADFRKDNADRIKPVFKEFVYLCRSMNLYGAQLVAIDGCKFKAVNSRKRNFNKKTLAEHLKRAEEGINKYLKMLDENDKNEDAARKEKVRGLGEKLDQLEEKKLQYERIQDTMERTGQTEVSLTDPDSRLMRVNSQQLDVCYNVQSVVDAKSHLIVDYDVTNSPNDKNQLAKSAIEAKQVLGVDTLEVTSDNGFYVEKDVKECEDNGIKVFMPIPAFNPARAGVPEPEFRADKFVYNGTRDVYVCPRGKELPFWRLGSQSNKRGRLYRTRACATCLSRVKCTTNKLGRLVFRSEYRDAVDRMRARVECTDGKEKLKLRRELAEHPFGTMKRAFNQGYLLLKGIGKVKGEIGFTMLTYNMRRAINVLGVNALLAAINVAGNPEGRTT